MIKRVGIVAHVDKPGSFEIVNEAIGFLETNAVEVLLNDESAKALSMKASRNFNESECLLVVGGDGTILRSARTAIELDIPIVGVNFGRVGFLSEVEPENLIDALTLLLNEDCWEEKRLLLDVDLDGEHHLALNDALVCKHHHSHTIEIEVFVDGRLATRSICDGMLVSTPTGSTAYALSAGGPIVDPNLDSMQITPICPHTITARPIMTNPDSVIEIRLLDDRYNYAELCVDGSLVFDEIKKNQTIFVRKALKRLRFIRFGESNYFDIVRKKLFSVY